MDVTQDQDFNGARLEVANRLPQPTFPFILRSLVRHGLDGSKNTQKLNTEVRKLAGRWLGDVERRLEGREWIACADFTVADIMMAGVLRNVRKTDLMDPFPRIKAYYERCFARPAWQRTLGLYAERLGVNVDDIR